MVCPPASASAAISGPTLPVTSKRSALGPALSLCTPGSCASSGAGPAKVTSTFCAARWRSCASVSLVDEPALPEDADAVAQRLHLAEDVRGQEHRLPAVLGFLDALAKSDLHQRIQAAGGLVQQQQIGAGGQRGDQLHLLAIALRQRPDLLGRVQRKALDQRIAVGDVGAAAKASEELECLSASQRRPQKRLARDIGHPPVRIDDWHDSRYPAQRSAEAGSDRAHGRGVGRRLQINC
jgi:hypothetical protein